MVVCATKVKGIPTRNDLGSMDLDETFASERVTEQATHTSLDTKYGVIGRSSQVKDTVVQSGVLVDSGKVLEIAK